MEGGCLLSWALRAFLQSQASAFQLKLHPPNGFCRCVHALAFVSHLSMM